MSVAKYLVLRVLGQKRILFLTNVGECVYVKLQNQYDGNHKGEFLQSENGVTAKT